MKKAAIFFLITCCFYFACNQTPDKTMISEERKNDTTHFFQVTQFIQSQVAEVNKTPYFIYRIVTTDGKKDSTAINTSIFNQISNQFLKPDINDESVKKYYKESI